MDAAAALADLTEISAQVEAAAVWRANGSPAGAVWLDDDAAAELVRGALDLFAAGEEMRLSGDRKLTRVAATLRGGSVFAVRDGERGIVARTRPGAPALLVLHDLESCLTAIEDEPAATAKPARRSRARKPADAEAADA